MPSHQLKYTAFVAPGNVGDTVLKRLTVERGRDTP
jgi:hypothetical protein